MRPYYLIVFLLLSFETYSQKLPKFNLKDIEGNDISEKDLIGKNVYINVWETWCKPCLMEIPILNSTKERMKNIVFLAITPASKQKVIKTLQKYPFEFRIIPDAKDYTKLLGVESYPSHFFIDSTGNFSEIKRFAFSVTYNQNDYINGKPSKKEQEALFLKQNKDILFNKLHELLKNR